MPRNYTVRVEQYLLVMAGGALGSALRYAAGNWLGPLLPGFPWATLAVNVAGSLCIGLVLRLAAQGHLSAEARLFLAVGVLGGFTTFSAFSYETLALLERGEWLKAVLYVGSSVALGLLAVALAYRLR